MITPIRLNSKPVYLRIVRKKARLTDLLIKMEAVEQVPVEIISIWKTLAPKVREANYSTEEITNILENAKRDQRAGQG